MLSVFNERLPVYPGAFFLLKTIAAWREKRRPLAVFSFAVFGKIYRKIYFYIGDSNELRKMHP